jgi:hypothetical protein
VDLAKELTDALVVSRVVKKHEANVCAQRGKGKYTKTIRSRQGRGSWCRVHATKRCTCKPLESAALFYLLPAVTNDEMNHSLNLSTTRRYLFIEEIPSQENAFNNPGC